MAGFTPITTPEQLPPEGTSLETLDRDFKRLVPGVGPPDHAELAKDVAAFANRVGGVIIHGAAEDRRRGVLGAYTPVGDLEAKRIRDACSNAVRDLCSPQPIFSAERIARGSGFVVAVNVWPFPGQAVGVRRPGDPNAFSFPLRTGTDCVFLRPEQLPMLMIPELRRFAFLLERIPAEAREFVEFKWVTFVDDRQRVQMGGMTLRMASVDLETNSIGVQADAAHGHRIGRIPLDDVQAVWEHSPSRWSVRVSGYFDTNTPSGFEYKARPG